MLSSHLRPFVRTFVIPGLISATILPLGGPAAAADSIVIRQVVSVAPEDVQIVRRDQLDFVSLKGGAIVAPDGAPDLPARPVTLRLPQDMMVDHVDVTVLETRPIRGLFNVAPARTVSSDGTLNPLSASVPIVSDDGFYPASLAQPGHSGRMRGRTLGGVVYTPFRYNPATRQLEIVTRAELVVTLRPDNRDRSGAFVPLRREPWADDAFGRLANRLVANPAPDDAVGRAGIDQLKPLINSGAPFAPTFRPSVNGTPVEMVIITNETMQAQYQILADWKTRSGIPTVVRTVNWIKANYPNGVDTQETIRFFIRDAAQKWGTIWVLLGGDTDVIPARYGKTQFFGGEEIPTDLYYQCIDGSWNNNGNSEFGEGYSSPTDPGDDADLYPEVWIGRLATTTVAEAQAVVNKTLAYERNPLRNGYQKDFLALGEVLFPQEYHPGDTILFDGAEICEEAITHLHGTMRVARLYENVPDVRWPSAILENKPTVVDSLNAGFGIVHHVGHGYINTMAVGYSNLTLTNADADAASNGSETFFLYAINCTSSAIDFNCIAERYLLNPNGGSVASVGSTRYDFPSTGWSYQTEFYHLVFETDLHELGHAAAACKLPFVALSTQDNTNRWTQFTQIYFGDPSLPIYTAPPTDLSVSHNATVPLGATTFTVNVLSGGSPVDSARVCLNKANDEYVVGLTGPGGSVVLPFAPDSTGTVMVTVTADDHVPYQGSMTVTAPATPYLYAADQLIDDDATGSSLGNGDQKIDAGETIELQLPIRNRGGSTSGGITATMTSLSPFVTIGDGTSSYPAASGGALVSPTDPFVLSVSRNAPDRTEAKVHLVYTSGVATIQEDVILYVHAPVLQWFRQFPRDTTGNGNGNGVFAPNEDVTLRVELRNGGLGQARSIQAVLRSVDPTIAINDSTVSFGTIAGGSWAISRPTDSFRFQMTDTTGLAANGRKMTVSFYDFFSPTTSLGSVTVDPFAPAGAVTNFTARGSTSSIALTFDPVGTPDVAGYNIYRSSAALGPFSRINQSVTDKTAYYNDEGLPGLTVFYYKVAAQDSSGNEGPLSVVASASTTLPLHEGFPVELKSATNASVTIADLDYDGDLEILAGAAEIFALNPDGTEVYDGDADIRTLGVLTNTLNAAYWNAPTVGDIDLDGSPEVAAVSWAGQMYVWNEFGQVKSGWPKNINVQGLVDPNPLGSVAMGDADGDGTLELFVLCGRILYGFHGNGTELVDGDASPATIGPIKITSQPYSYGSPALVDLTGDGKVEVVCGMRDGKVHAFNPLTGAELPGFPYTTGGNITSSAAIGDIDNDGQPEIVIGASDNKMYALNPNGTLVSGWPQGISLAEDFDSSPAIGDITGDGIPDVVCGASNGRLFAWRNSGLAIFQIQIKDNLGANVPVRSSPILVDIDGNGTPEILVGDQIGRLHCFYANGTPVPGFPIQTGNLIEGGPAAWDINGDGLTEIVAESFDQKVYLWQTPWTFNKLASPWPMFRHDPRHTGVLTNPLFYQTGVPETPHVAPRQPVTLMQNAPNPFNPRTSIRYRVEPGRDTGEMVPLRLEIFSPTGRLVRVLVDQPMPAGEYEAGWDGTDMGGRPAASGIYYYRIVTPMGSESLKMTLMR